VASREPGAVPPARRGEPSATGAGAGPERAPGHMLKLLLWRHGQTAWNAQHRFQGHSDVPLDATGHEQARRTARYLAALNPDAIYSSDLARAAETADYLARLTGLPVQLDKDLRERGGGSWEGLTDAEIRTQYPAEYATWVPPDGESVTIVADRTAAALQRIADSLDSGSLGVLVSHGAAINLAMSRLLGLPEQVRVLGPLGNCAWSVLGRRDGHWRLLEHNAGKILDQLAEPVSEAESEPVEVLTVGPEQTPLAGSTPGPGSGGPS
jgi:glucosyl-3-phosphoglycerate phosphatase